MILNNISLINFDFKMILKLIPKIPTLDKVIFGGAPIGNLY